MNLIQIRNVTDMLLFEEKFNQQDWNSVYVSNDVHEALYSSLRYYMGFVMNVFLLEISIIKKKKRSTMDYS